MSSAIAITAGTTSSYFALAAAGSSPPAWMWGALIGVNAALLTLAGRRTVRP